jgi:hypothetical protein
LNRYCTIVASDRQRFPRQLQDFQRCAPFPRLQDKLRPSVLIYPLPDHLQEETLQPAMRLRAARLIPDCPEFDLQASEARPDFGVLGRTRRAFLAHLVRDGERA